MNNLATRLRGLTSGGMESVFVSLKLIRAAADEIDLLTAERDALRNVAQECQEYFERNVAAWEENQK